MLFRSPSDPTIWLYGDVQGNVDQDDSDIYPFTNRVYYTVFNPWIGYPYARWNTNCGCSSGCCFSDNYCGEKVSDWEDFGTPTFSVGEQHWFTNKGWDGMTYYHRMVRNDDSDCKEFVLYIDDAPPTKEGEPRHAYTFNRVPKWYTLKGLNYRLLPYLHNLNIFLKKVFG